MWKKRRKKGQSIVEFALVLPVFVIFMALMIDGIQLLYAKGMTYYGSYAASRAASVATSTGAGQAAAQVGIQNMPGVMDVTNPTVRVVSHGSWHKGTLETATATMTVHLFMGLPDGSLHFNQQYNISTPMTMMIENG